MKKIFISLIAGTLMLTGCGEDSAVSQHGGVAVKVEVDSRVINGTESRSSLDDLLGSITPEQLKVKLEHESGKHVFSYDSFDDLPTTYEFPIGDYTVTASYGDIDIEGIDQPSFEGKTTINVRENRETPVSLTAKLANCILKVDYTDRFKEYMTSYYSQLNSSSGNTFNIPAGNDDNLFFKPGSTSVTVGYTKPDGKSGTVTINQFEAKAQHLYKVTFDIDNSSGLVSLNVTFNDKIIADQKPIDLSDDVDVIPVPYLIARGFDPHSTTPIDFIENLPFNDELDIQVVAMGGLQSVKLMTESEELCNEAFEGNKFPKEIDLIGTSEEDKALLRFYGLEVNGLWVNPDQMGIVDFSSILKSIRYKDGKQTKFTVVVTDRYGRESSPMTLTLNPIQLVLQLTSTNGTDYALGMYEDEAHVHVQYNGGIQFANQLRFVYFDKNGNEVSTKVNGIQQTPESNNPGNDKYRLCAFVKVPSGHEDVKIKAYCGTHASNEVTFSRVGSFMYFDELYDPVGLNTFATSAKVHLNIGAINRSSIEIYARKKGEGDGAWTKVESSDVPAGSTAPIITVTGLEPDTKYELEVRGYSNMPGSETTLFTTEKIFEIHTEAATQLPNGNMDIWYRDPGLTDYWWVDYPGANMSETVWGTMNQLTTSIGDGNATIPNHHGASLCSFSGTRNDAGRIGYNGDYCAIIETVGWGNNDAPGIGTDGAKNVTPGELYLTGSCNISTGNAEYEKFSFSSRPSGMKFWYKYRAKNSADYGAAEIEVFDANGKRIAYGIFNPRSTSSWTEYTIPLTYSADCAKAAYIQIKFKSSVNADCLISNKNNLDWPPRYDYKAGRYTGSGLYIDDIELVY